jgi:acyl carrier protein
VQNEGFAERVSALVASVLGEPIEADAPLMDSGLDSLGAVELRNSLAASFNLQLPATVVFDYPTIEALSKYIASLSTASKQQAPLQKQQQQTAANNEADIKQVLSIVSLVLGSDEIQEDQLFMEVSKF